jgi:hypothetical protein
MERRETRNFKMSKPLPHGRWIAWSLLMAELAWRLGIEAKAMVGDLRPTYTMSTCPEALTFS